MVMERNIEMRTHGLEPAGNVPVGPRRLKGAAWMIVRKDQGGRPAVEGTFHHPPGVERALVDRPFGQDFATGNIILVIQKESGNIFVGQMAEIEPQIGFHIPAVGNTRPAFNPFPKGE